MHVKKKGYVLLSTVALTFFITNILIFGAKITKMNLNYIDNYKVYTSFMDLTKEEVEVLESCNKWLMENSDNVIKNIDQNTSEIENVYTIPDKNKIKLHYLREEDVFRIEYGIANTNSYLYCLYERLKEGDENINNNIKENTKDEIIKLIPKREVKIK